MIRRYQSATLTFTCLTATTHFRSPPLACRLQVKSYRPPSLNLSLPGECRSAGGERQARTAHAGAATRTSGPAASRQGRSRTSALADGLRGAGVALFPPHPDLAEPDGQGDQFGQRPGAHPRHALGPVHLAGARANAAVGGDLARKAGV